MTFPNFEDLPAGRFKRKASSLISLDVAYQLLDPVRFIRARGMRGPTVWIVVTVPVDVADPFRDLEELPVGLGDDALRPVPVQRRDLVPDGDFRHGVLPHEGRGPEGQRARTSQ